jgi:ribosomal subunit interface protein
VQLEIQTQHTDLHPRWREIIERRSAKLREFCKEVVHLHVTLVHSTHHVSGNEEVRVLAMVPGTTLRVQKVAPGMGDALHAAFTALERELHTFVERRRGV